MLHRLNCVEFTYQSAYIWSMIRYCTYLVTLFYWNKTVKKKHTLRIPFRTLQRKRKQLGIPFRGTNKETNCRNSVPNHSAKENPAQNKTRQPKISIIVSEKTTFEVRRNHFAQIFCLFPECSGYHAPFTRVRSPVRSRFDHRGRASSVKFHFFAGFRSVLFRSELRNWLFRGTRNASEWALSSAE